MNNCFLLVFFNTALQEPQRCNSQYPQSASGTGPGQALPLPTDASTAVCCNLIWPRGAVLGGCPQSGQVQLRRPGSPMPCSPMLLDATRNEQSAEVLEAWTALSDWQVRPHQCPRAGRAGQHCATPITGKQRQPLAAVHVHLLLPGLVQHLTSAGSLPLQKQTSSPSHHRPGCAPVLQAALG